MRVLDIFWHNRSHHETELNCHQEKGKRLQCCTMSDLADVYLIRLLGVLEMRSPTRVESIMCSLVPARCEVCQLKGTYLQYISTTHTGRPDAAPDSSYIFGGLALFPNMSLSQFVTPKFQCVIDIVSAYLWKKRY